MFKTPFSFDGRIRRLEYGLSMIIYTVVYCIVLSTAAWAQNIFTIVFAIAVIPMVWFLWAQGAKRCHDMGKSGWMQLIPFYFLVMIFMDGEPDPNEYGVNPKFPDSVGTSETLDGHLKNPQ